MLSRVTHMVLLVAVAALTIALMQVSHRSAVLAPSPAAEPKSVDLIADNDLPMFGAALGPFDSGDLAIELSGALAMTDDSSMRDPQSAGAGSDRSPGRGPGGDGREHRNWGGGGGGGDDRGRGGMPKITEEIAARCLEVAAEVDAELAQRLLDARKRNPDEFEQQMRAGGFGRRLLALAQLKTHDPLLYRQKISELSQAVQIERTVKQLRAARGKPDASPGEIESLEAQLRTLLQIQLAMSIKARGDLLCKFNDRVAELQKELERDAANFQSIIDARMKVLASDPPSAVQPNPADAESVPAVPSGQG